MSVEGSAPQLAGHPTANAILRQDASRLASGCSPRTELDARRLASFVWKCPSGRLVTATIDLTGDRQLALSDLLTGSYASYLSSVASAQFSAEGVADPSVHDLSVWYLSPAALNVVFPSGSVAFPISSLTPYLRDPTLFS